MEIKKIHTRPKVIGFDLDQTLYVKLSEIDEAIQQYIYEKISYLLDIDLKTAEIKFKELYQNGKGLSGSTTLITLGFQKEEAKNIVQEALENADIDHLLNPNPELNTFLEKLSSHYKLDIITGSNRKNAFKKLSSLNIPTHLFGNIITSDEAPKTDASAYKLWLSKYPDLNARHFLYIGDRASSDYVVPNDLGIASILVNIDKADPNYDCPQLKNILDLKNILPTN